METLQVIIKVLVLIFVTTSMASLGLSLKLREIAGPWRKPLLVIGVLSVNLGLVPAIAFCITRFLDLNASFEAGLLLLGMAAGAPFVPKLVEVARADVALSASVMLLQMVGTILLMPVLLPWLISGIQADAITIALPLVVQMFIPLTVGLVIHHYAPGFASRVNPVLELVSPITMIAVVILLFVINFRGMMSTLGSGAILVTLLFAAMAIAGGLTAGYINGHSPVVQGIASGQRNIPAALVVASSNHLPADVVGMLMLITFVSLIPIVGFALYCRSKPAWLYPSIQSPVTPTAFRS